jgi:hypothetical protein
MTEGDKMEKLRRISIVTFLIMIIVFGTIVGMLFYASDKTEKIYQQALKDMNSGSWNSSLELIQEVPHYKEASQLYIYIYANKFFFDKYANDDEMITAYNKAMNYIKANTEKLESTGGKKYIPDLQELNKVMSFKISESQAKNESDKINADFNEAINLIKQGNYASGREKLNKISNLSLSPQKEQIISYLDLLDAIKLEDKSAINKAIESLNPGYTGALSSEIKTSVQEYADMDKWNRLYNKKNAEIQEIPEQQTTPPAISVKIGSAKNDVLQAFGNPVKQTNISNRYGVFDILYFSGNRAVYIENNKVTVIKN